MKIMSRQIGKAKEVLRNNNVKTNLILNESIENLNLNNISKISVFNVN